MEIFLRTGFMSNSKSISILVGYMVVTLYLHICGCAISLPKHIKVPAVLVFGDSIVDPGNNNYIKTMMKADIPPYGRDFEGGNPTGRFNNGRIASDLFAQELGVKELLPPYLDPFRQISDLLTGVSFALGSSGFDPFSSASVNVLSLDDQLKLFRKYISKLRAAVGENTTSTIISLSVYLVCAGSNDITNTYFSSPVRSLKYNIPSYANMMVNWAATFTKELYALGARSISVTTAPPAGCLPSQRTLKGGPFRECSAKENQAAITYNKKLHYELRFLRQRLPGLKIALLDVYTPLLDLIMNPSHYGFEVTNIGCCGTENIEASVLCTRLNIGTCTNASKYIFWDSFHPTEAAYKFLVHHAVQKNINDLF